MWLLMASREIEFLFLFPKHYQNILKADLFSPFFIWLQSSKYRRNKEEQSCIVYKNIKRIIKLQSAS